MSRKKKSFLPSPLDRAAIDPDLSLAGKATLLAIAELGPLASRREIAAAAGIAYPTVSGAKKHLVDLGYVTVTPRSNEATDRGGGGTTLSDRIDLIP